MPARYIAVATSTSQRAWPFAGTHGGGQRDRDHLADVEQRVVEREHAASRLVRDVLLGGRVDAQLDHLAGRRQHERGQHDRRQRHRQPEPGLGGRGDHQRTAHRAAPAEPADHPGR